MRNDRRGTVMVLALAILVVLVVLGLTWFQVTREVRRDSQIVYHRLHATTALGNGLREAQALFQARVNDAGVQPAEGDGRRDLARRRRQEGTGRNDDAWRRFKARNRRAADRGGEFKLDDDRDEAADDDQERGVPPSEWYQSFRAATRAFMAELPVPAANGLTASLCPGVTVGPVALKVVSLEPPRQEAGRGTVTAGVVALLGVARVKGPGFRFSRTLEWHLPFRLVEPEPPAAGSG